MADDKERGPRDIKERTFSFALDIVHMAQRLDECPGVSRALGRQLFRSGTSIGANVDIGYYRSKARYRERQYC